MFNLRLSEGSFVSPPNDYQIDQNSRLLRRVCPTRSSGLQFAIDGGFCTLRFALERSVLNSVRISLDTQSQSTPIWFSAPISLEVGVPLLVMEQELSDPMQIVSLHDGVWVAKAIQLALSVNGGIDCDWGVALHYFGSEDFLLKFDESFWLVGIRIGR